MVKKSLTGFNPTNLVELLRWRALRQPKKLAYTYLVDGEKQEINLTYEELDSQALAICALLQDLGMQGERALLLYPPGLDYIASFFGCLYAGVVAVPAYPPRLNRPVPRIQAIVADSRAKVALTTSAILENIESRFEHAPDLAALEWRNTDGLPENLEADWQEPAINADTLAFIQYTSGSTSVPKGVMLSHGNLVHNLKIINHGFQIQAGCIGVFWLPSYHDMGLIGGILEPLYIGESSTLMSPISFLQRPIRWLQAITRYRGTITGAPNFAYDFCVTKTTPEEREGLDLSSLMTAFCGAEPIRAETLEHFAETFEPYGFRRDSFYPCYGLAEGTLLVSGGEGPGVPVVRKFIGNALKANKVVLAIGNDGDSKRLVGSGGSLLGNRILIVDPETNLQCEPDEVGEVWISGPSVARGYWRRPAETRQAFQAYLADTGEGPFLRTGDLGFMQEGELFITGRLKDLIIIRGRNYYPQDIELTVEQSHKALKSISGGAFSVEVDDEERLVIVHELARKHRNANTEEIFAAVRRAIAEIHQLQVHVVVLLKPLSIPMTSSGKVKRHACKAGFLDGTLKTIAEWRASMPAPDRAGLPETASSEAEAASANRVILKPEAEKAIEGWLIDQIASRIRLPPSEIDPREPFTYYGLDSVQAVGLTGDLEIWLGRRLSPTLAWDYPNIESLARHLAAETSDQPVATPNPAATGFNDPIAIIGLGCRFPNADDPEAFWQLLRNGVDVIREVPDDRWDVDAFYEPSAGVRGKANTRWGGFLEDVASFDPGFFGISPREASRMDPQQRLLLEVSWEALENAGQAVDQLAGTRSGVFIGISSYDYSQIQYGDYTSIDAYTGTGNAHSIAANRVSYLLDLRGPSMAVDTACSSSLVAVHLAMQSLRNGESDLALAGGVNVMLSPELTITFSQARMMAPDGRCKTFDARANGYVRGEGCGVVVLKRLGDALRDGDNILALLRGSAVNQDGRSNGLTAPNGPSQQAVIRKALEAAAVQPAQISYVEAHGTGTPLGDPIEIQSLRAVLETDRPANQSYAVGSVKTNIGHLEAAAGVAGLIKVVLSLTHEEIPPHLHLEEVNPYIALAGSPLEIVTELRPWERGPVPRIAGVSSFGFGGTNAHLVVAEAPAFEVLQQDSAREIDQPLYLLNLSAKREDALKALAVRYERHLAGLPKDALANVCFTANQSRSDFDHRLAVIGESTENIRASLDAFRKGEQPENLIRGKIQARTKPRIVFLFTGQGAQYVGMGRQLYDTQPVFREALDKCSAMSSAYMDRPLLSVLYPDPDEDSPLSETRYTQPALFALEYALAELWRSWGIEPAAVMGHSVGEYVAACVSGVFSLEAGLRLIAERGRLMQAVPEKGAMAAVFAGRAQVESILDPYQDRVVIAARNGPENIVISGEQEAVRAVLADLESMEIAARQLNVSQAFHSPLMDPILESFERTAQQVEYASPKIPLVSNLTGDLLGTNVVPGARYWRRHVREPVDFAAGIDALANQGFEIYLEIGPNPVLSGMGRRILASRQPSDPAVKITWLPSLRQGKDDWGMMLKALGGLYVRGVDVNWAGFDRDNRRQKVALPTYPFARERYWLTPQTTHASPTPIRPVARHPKLGQRMRSPLQIYETILDLTDLSGQEKVLREMVVAAAVEVYGEGGHQNGDFAVFDLPDISDGASTAQTIITSVLTRSAVVEIYTLSGDQEQWGLLARGEISPGKPREAVGLAPEEIQDQPLLERQLTRESALNIEPENRRSFIEIHLRDEVSRVLGLEPDRLQMDQPLDRLGLDSLMAIELKNKLEITLGVVLPIVNFLEGPSISQLSIQVIDQLTAPTKDFGVKLGAVADPGEDHPLAYNQQSLWFLRQLTPENVSFNVSGAVRIHGKLNISHLRNVLEKIMARHASLRTTFPVVDGQPVQRIHETFPVPLQLIDGSTWTESDRHEFLIQKAHESFDLERSPAFRVILLHHEPEVHIVSGEELAAEGSVLLLAMDHMVSDFWSIAVLVREVMGFYQEASTGLPVNFEPVKLQYTDYVHWQREMLASPAGDRLLVYWENELRAGLPLLDLPTDRPRPSLQTYRGDSQSITLNQGMTDSIKALASAQNVTLFMMLLAAFQVLLHRFSGQDEFLVGSVTAGRSQPDLTGLVGYFINPLALRADLSENPSFNQLLTQVRQTVLGAIEHQDYPPALLYENLPLRRDPSRPPLFETMFIMQKAQLPEVSALSPFALGIAGAQLEMGDLVLESLPITNQPAQFDLTLMMTEMDDCLAANLHYNTDLFDSSTVSRMLRHFETLIEGILANPDQPVGSISLLTPAERNEILVQCNATKLEYPPVESAHQIIEVQASQTPDATAVIFEGEHLTYRALNEQANQLAHHLQALGVGPEQLVGIYLDRSPAMVVSLLGVHKAGGAYVPLDPDYPQERLGMMLADSQPLVILTQDRLKDSLPEQDFQIVSLDGDWEAITSRETRNPTSGITAENLAYVIYTSGSTGVPKGAQITHWGMVNFLNSMRVKPGLSAEDLLLAVTTLSFDIAVLELFLPLTVGASVEVVSREVASDGARLVEKLANSGATMMQATPTTWRMMMEAGWQRDSRTTVGQDPGAPGAGLTILCGGEALPRDLAEKLLERGTKVWNMYGPTETTVWSTIYQVHTGDGPLPVGHPIGNTQVYVLDPDMQPVPVGVVGELYIGGDGVARGYRNRADLTAEKFVDDPFRPDKKARLYKTGDLARLRADGSLMFLGRIDHQVKMRGFRIELGEIEAALIKHPALRETVVVAHEDAPGEVRLVAYSVLNDQETEPQVNELRNFLRRWLPDYMVPATFVTLDALPLTPNGKLDRQSLPAPAAIRPNLAETYVAPRNEQEMEIAAICVRILGLERVGIHDDFFDLGGNSLSATRLIFQIQEIFDVKLPLIKIFETPTIVGLSQAIEQARLAPNDSTGIFGTVSIAELNGEVHLDPAIAVNDLNYKPVEDPEHIFLTGATGFLGAHLLQGLLNRTNASIYCLVRAVDREAAAIRLRNNLLKYSLWNDDYQNRIVPVSGDLGRPWLGLSAEVVEELAHTVDLIYHNGAMVNLVYPYQSHKPTNVGGTIEVLRFAAKERIKPLHFISSLSVLHTPDAHREDIIGEDKDLDGHGVPLGGYAQSKWVGEKLVQEAGARGIPFTIFRPGLISGHSQNGSWNEDDLMFSLLDATLTLGSAPDLDVILDIVPVDYVTDAVIYISSQPDPFGKIYHLSAEEQTNYKDLLTYIKDQGYPLRTVSYDQWKRDLFELAEENPQQGWNVYLPLIADVGAQVLNMPRFGQENTKAGLKGTSIQSAPLSPELLSAYFRHFIESGRLQRPLNGGGEYGS